jgi:hypothetical protein
MKSLLAFLKFMLIYSIFISGQAYAENLFLSCVNDKNDYVGDSYARETPYADFFAHYGTKSDKSGTKSSIEIVDRKLTLIPIVGERVNYFNFALSDPSNVDNSAGRGYFIFNSEKEAKAFCLDLSKQCTATFGQNYRYPMAGSDQAGLKRILILYQLPERRNGFTYNYCPNPSHKMYPTPKLSFEQLKNCNMNLDCVTE